MRQLRSRLALDRSVRQGRALLLVIVALVGASVAVAALQDLGHIPFASPVYLLAVLIVGMFAGTIPAVATGVASFLLYDYLFTQPLHTLTVSDPDEWLNLLLFLVIAVVIGRLVAVQASQAAQVAERARESIALFRISRSLATSDSLVDGARAVLDELAVSTSMDRVWLGLGGSGGDDRVVADSAVGEPLPVPSFMVVLQRRPGDEPAAWTRTHLQPVRGRRGAASVFRIRVEVPGDVLGSLWALRTDRADEPDRAETRVLAAAADQLGQAVAKERLGRKGLEAEVARRSEALKTALLDSVSHDLRTPLATIRAAAGSMLDPGVAWTDEERDGALRSIDAQAERMNRLVRNLLDLSRIEGGALKPELEPHDLDEVVGSVVRRLASRKSIRVEVAGDLPPVLVDDTYIDEVLTNLVENAIKYGGDLIRIGAARVAGQAQVEIAVEDDGPGVADSEVAHLFEKFYRVKRRGESSRQGMGIGLTVAQGLSQAMNGQISAGRSELGGLAVRLRFPSVELPPESGEPGRPGEADAGTTDVPPLQPDAPAPGPDR